MRGAGDHECVKILLVEDEDSIAAPLTEGLQREGFTVERVATGAAALEAGPADCVLLDLRLPDIDGYEVCRSLRARSDVPIIMDDKDGALRVVSDAFAHAPDRRYAVEPARAEDEKVSLA